MVSAFCACFIKVLCWFFTAFTLIKITPTGECCNIIFYIQYQKSSSISSLDMTIDFRFLFSNKALTRHIDKNGKNEEKPRNLAFIHHISASLCTTPSLPWDVKMCCNLINVCIHIS